MARSRFEKLDPEKQEAILAAAGAEFAERGYEAASINRIIERSGMSKGSVYYYFEDKADLFTTVMDRSLERLLDETGWRALEVVGADEFWDTLRELTHLSVDYVARDSWWMSIARAVHHIASEPDTPHHVLMDVSRQWWTTIISRGRELGVVRTDLPTDLLVAISIGADAAGDRWMMEHWDDLSDGELTRIVDGRIDLVRDMLDKENEGWES